MVRNFVMLVVFLRQVSLFHWGKIYSGIFSEADRLENSIDPEWLEVDIQKPIRVTKKVLIPNFRHPHVSTLGACSRFRFI